MYRYATGFYHPDNGKFCQYSVPMPLIQDGDQMYLWGSTEDVVWAVRDEQGDWVCPVKQKQGIKVKLEVVVPQ
jgi:hypothetical protein